eukprot:UN01093
MALTSGVTASLFSDFGDEHAITDIDGEPTETFAVSSLEVVKYNPDVLEVDGAKEGDELIVISIAGNAGVKHGLDDGSLVALDDFSDSLKTLNQIDGLKSKTCILQASRQ